MPPWPFRKMKFTISGFPAAAYLSLKTIWSNICRQWNCFKAFCWYLGYTFPHNHSDQTWSQSCWKALLPFLREPEVDIPTKVFNYLYEFGLRPIRPFIMYINWFGNRTCNFVPWCAILLFLNPTCWWLQIYIYSVYACVCMHVQFSGNLYVFLIYIYIHTYMYIYICICKYIQTSPSIQLCSPEIGNDIP